MANDDAWAAGEDAAIEGGADLGVPVEEGHCTPSVVMSPMVFFPMAWAVLTGAPVLVLLAGLNLWLASFVIPQALNLFLAMPIGVSIGVMKEAGTIDPVLAEVLPQLVSFVVGFAMFPVQLLVTAGALVGIGHWIKTGEVKVALLYMSFRQAVNAFLFGLLSMLVSVPVALACFAPVFGAIGLLFAEVVDESSLAPLLFAAFGLSMVLLAFAAVFVLVRITLGQYAAVLDDRGPFDALGAAWRRVDLTTSLWLIVNGLLLTIVTIPLACTCVGQIPVFGFQLAAFTAAWLCISRDRDALETWHLFQTVRLPL